MPIYEFKCLKCGEFIEILVMGSNQGDDEVKCPKCGEQAFERVMSAGSHSMKGTASGTQAGSPFKQERTCSSGSCSTYTVPGKA